MNVIRNLFSHHSPRNEGGGGHAMSLWLVVSTAIALQACDYEYECPCTMNRYPLRVIVDDYEQGCDEASSWTSSRIGTDRGIQGEGEYSVTFTEGRAEVEVTSGQAGVWTSLRHRAVDRGEDDVLDTERLLGRLVVDYYQVQLVGIEVDLENLGAATELLVELKNAEETVVFEQRCPLDEGDAQCRFPVTFELVTNEDGEEEPLPKIKLLSWSIVGEGHVIVEDVRLIIDTRDREITESVFLYAYSHLGQCHDSASGVLRDRAIWPAEDFGAVNSMGLFALTASVASHLAITTVADAREIVEQMVTTVTSLPTCHGLLPHFITTSGDGWDIVEDTEWSSIDTVIVLVSLILAAERFDIDTADLEQMLNDIDWSELTDTASGHIAMGYDYVPDGDHCGSRLGTAWQDFGSEELLMAWAYTSATGETAPCPNNHGSDDSARTRDESGFNSELAALFLPLDGVSRCGVSWEDYRPQAMERQFGHFWNSTDYPPYRELGLFGVSASEVPEPCAVSDDDVYGAWGIGGIVGMNDGSELLGYPIVAPHYAAMVMNEFPESSETMFAYLLESAGGTGILTPLNNVESLGLDESGEPRWSSLKGSWNLGMTALGVGRALVREGEYPPYVALAQNELLSTGFAAVVSGE